MDFTPGQQITLGKNTFEIKQFLGSGAIANAYLARPLTATVDVVIKVAREDLENDDRAFQDVLAGLSNEVRVLKTLNAAEDPDWNTHIDLESRLERAQATAKQRQVIALLDNGEFGQNRLFQVQEKAPPAITSFDIKSVEDERQFLLAMEAVLNVIALAHKNNLSLKDFEPNTKWDRIRLAWLDEQHEKFELKIIDWNITGGLESAPLDLLYFGGHLYRFLFNRNLAFGGTERNQPPHNLSSITPNWEYVTEGSRQIFQKLLQSVPGRRYQKVGELQYELRWWLDVLAEAQSPDGLANLQNRLWTLKRQEKFNQMSAVADLGKRLFATNGDQQIFQSWLEQACQELEKQEVLPLAHARGTLLIGAFEKAANEFQQGLNNLPKESEAARQAQIYLALAHVGMEMKASQSGMDVRNTLEWHALERGVDEFIKRRPEAARQAFEDVLRCQPEFVNRPKFKVLSNKAEASLKFQQLTSELQKYKENPVNPLSDLWAQTEKQQLELIRKLLERLQEVANLDPDNQEILACYQEEQGHLKQRQEFLTLYETVKTEMERGGDLWQKIQEQLASGANADSNLPNIQHSLNEVKAHYQTVYQQCKAILSLYPGHLWASYQQERSGKVLDEIRRTEAEVAKRIDNFNESNRIRDEIVPLVQKGEYVRARNVFFRLRQTGSIPSDLQAWETLVIFAGNIQDELRGQLDVLGNRFSKLQVSGTDEILQKLNQAQEKSLASLGGETPPAAFAQYKFTLNEELRDRFQQFSEKRPALREKEDRLRQLEPQNIVGFAITCEEAQSILKSIGLDLDKNLQDHLSQAQAMLGKYKDIRSKLSEKPDFATLEEFASELNRDNSEMAQQVLAQCAVQWEKLVRQLPDETEIITQLEHGILLFSGLKQVNKLAAMRDQVAQLDKLRQDLHESAWLSEGNDSLRLERHITALQTWQNEAWPFLVRAAKALWEHLTEIYRSFTESFVKKLQKDAEQTSNVKNVLEKLQQQKLVYTLLSENFAKEINSFASKLESCELASKAYNFAIEKLADELSFTETFALISEIPLEGLLESHAVYFRRVRQEWQSAGSIEQILGQVPRPDGKFAYISQMQEIVHSQKMDFPELHQLPQISARLEILFTRLSEQKNKVLEALFTQFEGEAKQFQQQPEKDFSRLVELYWQLLWCDTQAEGLKADINKQCDFLAAQRQIELCGQAVDTKIIQTLAGVKDEQDLSDATHLANHLHKLLIDLHQPPAGFSLPLVQNDHLSANLPEAFKYLALSQALKELEELSKIDANDLSQVKSLIKRFGNCIEQILQSLPADQRGGASLSRLFTNLTTTLSPFSGFLSENNNKASVQGPLNSLFELKLHGLKYYEVIIKSTKDLWLLGKCQIFLQNEYLRLDNDYKKQLQEQAQGYLRSDLNNAIDQLWKNILEPCGDSTDNSALRVSVSEAIIQAGYAVSSQGSKGDSTTDNNYAKRVWHVVGVAAGKGKGISEWKELESLASKQEKIFSKKRIKWPLSVAGFVVLAILVAIVIRAIVVSNDTNEKAALELTKAVQISIAAQSTSEAASAKIAQVGTQSANQTKQAVIEIQQSNTAKAAANPTATQTPPAISAAQTAQAEQAMQAKCSDREDSNNYRMGVIVGQAELLPTPGYILGSETNVPPEVSASWFIKNSGDCAWPLEQLWMKLSDIKINFIRVVFRSSDNKSDIPKGKFEIRYDDSGDKIIIKDGELISEPVLIPARQIIKLTVVFYSIYPAVGKDEFQAKGTWALMLNRTSLGELELKLPSEQRYWIAMSDSGLSPTPSLVKPTSSPIPADTRMPTNTPTITETRVPTGTPTPKQTRVPTKTPTSIEVEK